MLRPHYHFLYTQPNHGIQPIKPPFLPFPTHVFHLPSMLSNTDKEIYLYLYFYSLASRSITPKARRHTRPPLERTNQPQTTRINTQSSRTQCSEEINKIKRIQLPLNHKPSHPSLHPRIDLIIRLRDRIKAFLGRHGIFLDLESEGEDSGESVCELQNADRAYKTRDVGELGDGGADYPGDDPVSGYECCPEEFALLGSERRGFEELLEDLDVGDFDADVAVESSGNETSDEVHDVASGLPVVGRETLHNGVVGILALVGVDEDTEEHVQKVDEKIGEEHALPEIPWVTHLCEEGDEDHGASVGVDGLVETIEGAGEAVATGGCSIGRCSGVAVDRARAEIGAEGGFSCFEIGRRVGGNTHHDEEDEHVDPH